MSGNEQHRPTIGRDELNLIDFPLGVLTATQPLDESGNRLDELISEVDVFDKDQGQVVPKRLTRRTASKEGFPTPKESDLLIGLLRLTELVNSFQEPRVEFRPAELFRLMNCADNGNSRQQLRRGLDRLNGLSLKFENSWRERSGQAYVKEFHTGILDGYQLTSRTAGRGGREPCWIQWSAELFADMRAGNLRVLDTEVFFSLKYPISRQMYRFLDKHLAEAPVFQMELGTFAAHIGLSERKHNGKIKERLKPAIRDLERLGAFVIPRDEKERFRKLGPGQWLIRFERHEAKRLPDSRRREDTAGSHKGAARLVGEFHRQWHGALQHRAGATELLVAQSIIEQYGLEDAIARLPSVLKVMKQEFPKARVFGGTQSFWAGVMKKRKAAALVEAAARLTDAEELKLRRLKRDRRQAIDRFRALPDARRDSIVASVRQRADNDHVRRCLAEDRLDDMLVLHECVAEMRRREAVDADSASGNDA